MRGLLGRGLNVTAGHDRLDFKHVLLYFEKMQYFEVHLQNVLIFFASHHGEQHCVDKCMANEKKYYS